jgi:hypothetical protein
MGMQSETGVANTITHKQANQCNRFALATTKPS